MVSKLIIVCLYLCQPITIFSRAKLASNFLSGNDYSDIPEICGRTEWFPPCASLGLRNHLQRAVLIQLLLWGFCFGVFSYVSLKGRFKGTCFLSTLALTQTAQLNVRHCSATTGKRLVIYFSLVLTGSQL